MSAITKTITTGESTRILKIPCRYLPQVLQGESWRDADETESVGIFGASILPHFAARADGRLMYLRGPFDIGGEQIEKRDGKITVSTGYPSGGCRLDDVPSPGWTARSLERAAAILMLEPGDMVQGWTYSGWRQGYFLDKDYHGRYRFAPVDGKGVEVVTHLEAKRFERHEHCFAQLADGSWAEAVYFDFRDRAHLVHLSSTWDLVNATSLDWGNSTRHRQ